MGRGSAGPAGGLPQPCKVALFSSLRVSVEMSEDKGGRKQAVHLNPEKLFTGNGFDFV